MMNTYHYLGAGPLCGAQIRYLIHSEVYGWLGGISFSSATWRLKACDEWIGWSEAARRLNLQRVKAHHVVLAVQDTTILNYTVHPATDGLGPISKKHDNAVGLVLHDTMAFTVEGTPLGLLDV